MSDETTPEAAPLAAAREDDEATNPFDDEAATFLVLRNEEGQHSLWPVFAAMPPGWERVHGPDGRQACLDYVDANWTDMRPLSLARLDD